jgi:hypothetical protein
MKYSINEIVHIIDSNEQKTIIDYEFIEGIHLYYMSDKTSYPECKLISDYEVRKISDMFNFKDPIWDSWKEKCKQNIGNYIDNYLK